MPRKKQKRSLWKLILSIALSSKIALLGAYYMGSRNPSFARRVSDSLFYDNVPVAEGSFKDPAGLEIRVELNESGEKESYLVHRPSGRRWAIGYDMIPKDVGIIGNLLEKRLREYDKGKRDSDTNQETVKRMNALARCIVKEREENRAEYDKFCREMKRFDDNFDLLSPKTQAEIMYVEHSDLIKAYEEGIRQNNSYIKELEDIMKSNSQVPYEACAVMIYGFSEYKEMLEGAIERQNLLR